MGSHRVGHNWSDLAVAYSVWGFFLQGQFCTLQCVNTKGNSETKWKLEPMGINGFPSCLPSHWFQLIKCKELKERKVGLWYWFAKSFLGVGRCALDASWSVAMHSQLPLQPFMTPLDLRWGNALLRLALDFCTILSAFLKTRSWPWLRLWAPYCQIQT